MSQVGRSAQVGRVVGTVVGLWRYPVKSMAAEALPGVEVSWNGLAGDRRWAFVRPGLERSGFPWLTAREVPALSQYRPRFVTQDQPETSTTLVRTPAGVELDVIDPALAAELGAGARVLRQSRGIFDTAPLSLLTTRSLSSLGARLLAGSAAAAAATTAVGSDAPGAGALSPLRFRPNLLIEPADPAGSEEYPEDTWVGSSLAIGAAIVRVDRRDQRCVMVNLDPDTGARDPSTLRTLARERAACFGVYGQAVRPGYVGLGDRVVLLAG